MSMVEKVEAVEQAYFRYAEAARYSSVSEQTVRRWVRENRLRVLRPSPGVNLIAKDDLDEMLRRSAAE